MNIEVKIVDFGDAEQAEQLLYLLNEYALDPMGGGAPLSEHVRMNLACELAKRDFATSFIAYVDGKPAGLVNCIEAFSSFACAPLINVHDLVVLSDFRGYGLSQMLLEKVEAFAREKDCCKITLEVLQGNEIARNAYQKFGFAGYELNPKMGSALFWQKALT